MSTSKTMASICDFRYVFTGKTLSEIVASFCGYM
ncbi:hypothetical protein F383_37540 [Gossypium arboreum]|uniref:Uncharacterized protein n=1 Tax=Gossypium arboreum TaxID=29729 RepID=A0A0B0M8I0_GOSAR|nr:hypothetical protein F383_37540 [Gossypium arboreum]